MHPCARKSNEQQPSGHRRQLVEVALGEYDRRCSLTLEASHGLDQEVALGPDSAAALIVGARETLDDAHALMRRMHRPDPKRPPEMQDKRSVVPIAFEDVDAWLYGTVEQDKALVQLPAPDLFDARPS